MLYNVNYCYCIDTFFSLDIRKKDKKTVKNVFVTSYPDTLTQTRTNCLGSELVLIWVGTGGTGFF